MTSILVDPPSQNGDPEKPQAPTREEELTSWVMGRVNRWREYRDNAFKARWGEYYRLWRGRWSEKDKNRSSERSRLIAPALSQAIEMTVAEQEEAAFGREQWFDVQEDALERADPQQQQAMWTSRNRLLEDLENAGVPDAISGSFLNGALYGELIGKILMDVKTIRKPGPPKPDGSREIEVTKKRMFRLDPIPADEFVPDPAGSTIEEMLGCAHELNKPLAWVHKMQSRGVFLKVDIGSGDGRDDKDEREDLEGGLTKEDTVFITEYHGLVPARLLPNKRGPRGKTELDLLLEEEEIKSGDETMVEAIVTIGNKGVLLNAVRNPFWMQDRSIVACQHEKVPGRFWGRGVAEKGFNPQKALDAELRARMDALALISNPMMAADITRMPRGFDLKIRPGKLWLTNGPPKDVLQPIAFQGLEPSTFAQTGEMERMVQMGTGAMDTATPIRQNERNSTATGSSLIQAGFVKRSKRAMANISRNFISPLIKKFLWRYMQFDEERYPVDVDFRVIGTLGIVAKELEQNQLTQMLGLVPEGSAPQLTLIKAIFDNSSSPYKAEVNAAVDSLLAPPSPEDQAKQQMAEQIQMATAVEELNKLRMGNQKTQSEIILNLAKAGGEEMSTDAEAARVEVEVQRLLKELEELREFSRQNDAALITAQANLIKAQKQTSGGGTENGDSS